MPENAKILTKDQRMARAAYACVLKQSGKDSFAEYRTFAYAFPALIHSCGLVQAAAFAQAKDKESYIADLQAVFNWAERQDGKDEGKKLIDQSREAPLSEYARISRNALAAASWLKRYCQAADDSGKTDAE